MRQRKTFYIPVRGHLIALATVALLASIVFSYQHFSSIQVAEAQARRQPRKGQPRRTTAARTSVSPSMSFNHEHHRPPRAKLDCSYCHSIPTQAAPDVIAAATKTSIKGYPYHDSCLVCHRSQTPPLFFRGATPTICTVCHTRSSPRLTPRDLSPFPKQDEQTMEIEFPGYFPHNHSGHKRPGCETCHMADQRADVAAPVGGNEGPFKLTVGMFKTSPSSHVACFECHWQKDKPTAADCAGCHLRPNEIAKEPRNQLSRNAVEWFRDWPREWPKRFSLKFNHESKEHKETDCTDCHSNIKQMNTLDMLKADVKILDCATCHFRKEPNIGSEMTEEDTVDTKEGRSINPASKEGKHTCTGCHTSAIGSTATPCSHFLLPDKYLDLEDYSDNARQIAKQCKENKK